MRLDFDHDGSVSIDDLKKSMVGLYEFLKNFDVIETTSQIKSKLYSDAIAYMQAELDQENKLKQFKNQDEDEIKIKPRNQLENSNIENEDVNQIY